tara:strand:+ start:862 stop:1092 length:231 start_codon:yes stop_codon:yes gene_type:complete
MYVSYALGVAIFVAVWVISNWFFGDISVWVEISVLVFLIVALSPLLFSLSKIMYANIFIHFDETISTKQEESVKEL